MRESVSTPRKSARVVRRFMFLLVLLSIAPLCKAAEREITFQTDDGWTIHGTFSMPDSGSNAPAVLLLHSSGHDKETFNKHYAIPGLAQSFAERGVATLRIDLRGRGESIASQELHSFTQGQRDKIALDVKGAINFICSQKGIDTTRIAVLAEEFSADAAVMGTMNDSRIKVYTFISGRMGEEAKKYLEQEQPAVLCVVSSDDKPGFADMTAVYGKTKNSASDIFVFNHAGIGTTMFYKWRHDFPNDKPIDLQICDWVSNYLDGLGFTKEVSFQSEDGWTIYGDLTVPQGSSTVKRPGIVLMHTALSDRYVYHDLVSEMTSRGIVVFSIDWRGRGKSRGKGKYSEIKQEERERGYLDAKGAINVLASQPSVDPSRIAVLGTDRGALHAVKCALDDPRVTALVILTVIFTPAEKESLAKLQIPVMYVASKGISDVTRDLTEAYHISKNKGSRLTVMPGSRLGYQLLESNPETQALVADWLKTQFEK